MSQFYLNMDIPDHKSIGRCVAGEAENLARQDHLC